MELAQAWNRTTGGMCKKSDPDEERQQSRAGLGRGLCVPLLPTGLPELAVLKCELVTLNIKRKQVELLTASS